MSSHDNLTEVWECPACGASNRDSDCKRLISIDAYAVAQCTGCGLGRTTPFPGSPETDELYDKNYFERDMRWGDPPDPSAVGRDRSQKRRLQRVVKAGKRSGRLVDLGCGCGAFLIGAGLQGFQPFGVEISPWAAGQARRLGVNVVNSSAEDIEFGAGSLDVVTMFHSLEHTRDPLLVIQKVFRWLSPNGVLVAEVPDSSSVDAHEVGEEWRGWRLPHHLWHFNCSTLRLLMERVGLRVVYARNNTSDHIAERLKSSGVPRRLTKVLAHLYRGPHLTMAGRTSWGPDSRDGNGAE